MNYAEAIQFLYGLRLFGAKFGLENTLKLTALAGHPQNRLRFIHVAGTNGKGSTCAMLESIYRAAGLRTGLVHLAASRLVSRTDSGESPTRSPKMKLSGSSEKSASARCSEQLTGHQQGDHPTFFEVVTVMALKFFAEQKCDLVIWETGLGGRWTRQTSSRRWPVSSPTSPSTTSNGSATRSGKIAAEKAGIIKPGVPVITAADEPEALR